MNDSEGLLSKAFTLARRRRDVVAPGLPFGLETAVFAEWRTTRAQSEAGILPIFQWAAILACVFALLSGTLKRDLLMQLSNRLDPEITVLESVFAQLDS